MHLFHRSALAGLLLATTAVIAAPQAARAQVAVDIGIGVAVDFPPPPLPVYDQPPIPGPDYIWTPGYWAWDEDDYDYYWAPGYWTLAPEPGLLWTPAWWGWQDGQYSFHEGYWAPQVGYYGGINYGFGYTGDDYQGGYWQNNHFYYNRSVTNVGSVNIVNVYNKTVVINNAPRASFNGPGGAAARPTPRQLAIANQRHIAPTPQQTQNLIAAKRTPTLHASANHGAPPVAATTHPGVFSGGGVIAARAGGDYHPPAAAVARQAQVRAAHGQAGEAPGARPTMDRPAAGDAFAPAGRSESPAQPTSRPATPASREEHLGQVPGAYAAPHEAPAAFHAPEAAHIAAPNAAERPMSRPDAVHAPPPAAKPPKPAPHEGAGPPKKPDHD